MQEIIEELRASAEVVPVPLDLPEEDDLLQVESEILLTLPSDYRTFLLEASDIVLGHLEPATAADPNSHTYLPELASKAWEEGLPRHVFPICEDKDAYYVMDEDGNICLWREGDFAEKQFESIWEWVREVWMKP